MQIILKNIITNKFRQFKQIAFTLWLFVNLYVVKCVIYILKIFLKPSASRKNKTVLYFENFPIENSGYQYRAQKWCKKLNNCDYNAKVVTTNYRKASYDFEFMNMNHYLVKSMWIRFVQICKSRKYEFVIVRRELLLYNDYGNLFMDKFLLHFHPNAILDIDDDIAAAKKEPRTLNGFISRILEEHPSKFTKTLNIYNSKIVVSSYLKKRIEKITGNKKLKIHVIPTCVDYNNYNSKKYETKDFFTLGWIGGNQNYFLLDSLLPQLQKLKKRYDFELLVIGGNKYMRDVSFPIRFLKWNLNTEVNNILKIDIGLMPLDESDASKGKGGFKLIQYMGLGIVSIASDVTINKEIVNHEKNAYLASGPKDWYNTIEKILLNKIDMAKMGREAKKQISSKYSFEANFEKYLNLFN